FAKLPRPSSLLERLAADPGTVDGRRDPLETLRDLALEASSVAQILLDANGQLLAANQQARTLFRLSLADVGRPLQDLELSYRPIELRSRLDEAYAERHPLTVREVEVPGDESG